MTVTADYVKHSAAKPFLDALTYTYFGALKHKPPRARAGGGLMGVGSLTITYFHTGIRTI
ncbi:hypothetical protein B0G57_113194, partial [Trinickia symbiotica]